MRCLLQLADTQEAQPLWLVLHGAYSVAEHATALFGQAAETHNAILLAPQATRPCGDGYCWSFAHDAESIGGLVDRVLSAYPVDRRRITLIGHSMGCAMGCWLLAQRPQLFAFFAALGMGSAFEPWEHDDGGIDRAGLRASAAHTRALLAVDQRDPAGTGPYFEGNLAQLRAGGRNVDTFRPNEGVHDVTAAMKAAVLERLPI